MADRERAGAGRAPGPAGSRGAPLARAATGPVIVSGYYGFGNLGDEAVLAGLIGELRARCPDARLMVLSADPAATAVTHGVEALPRSPLAVWRALGTSCLLISGGGSLVQDVTSARSALYYLGTMLAASSRRVPYAVVGQGIGPIRRPWVRRLAAAAFAGARVISVRDGESARTLAAMGVASEVHRGADLAFLATPAPPERVRALLAAHGLDAAGPRVGVAIRSWPGLGEPSELAGAIRRFAADCGTAVAVLPFDRTRDRAVSQAVAGAAGGRVVEVESPRDLLGLVGAMDLVLGVRLHALIFAAAQGVPAVGLAYDPKVSTFMTALGLPGLLPLGASGAATEEALSRTWHARHALRARLLGALPALREAAAAGVERVARLVTPGGAG